MSENFSLTTPVTKDEDFSDRVLLSQPLVLSNIKFGNMKMKEFHQTISRVWDEVYKLSEQHRLVCAFNGRIECSSLILNTK